MMTDPHAAAPGAAPKRSGSWHELSTRLREILRWEGERAPSRASSLTPISSNFESTNRFFQQAKGPSRDLLGALHCETSRRSVASSTLSAHSRRSSWLCCRWKKKTPSRSCQREKSGHRTGEKYVMLQCNGLSLKKENIFKMCNTHVMLPTETWMETWWRE